METTISQIQQLSYREGKTYALAAAFVAGNILLPQLCHMLPQGGLVWLPIYFFTLIAAYRYGITAGLLTAVASPLVNNMMFGMPPAPMLPIILIKSGLLALAAAAVASHCKKVSIVAVAAAIVIYQAIGTMAEWGMTGSMAAALQDLRLGWPGLLVQLFGGFALLKLMARKAR